MLTDGGKNRGIIGGKWIVGDKTRVDIPFAPPDKSKFSAMEKAVAGNFLLLAIFVFKLATFDLQ